MDLQLRGKRALVTGSSIGIGESIARGLAAEGVRVVVHGRERERTERVARQIVASGGDAIAVLGDLTRDAEVERLCGDVVRRLGGIDILVNNAGGVGRKKRVGCGRCRRLGRDFRSQCAGDRAAREARLAGHAGRKMGADHQHFQRGRRYAPGHRGRLRREQGGD